MGGISESRSASFRREQLESRSRIINYTLDHLNLKLELVERWGHFKKLSRYIAYHYDPATYNWLPSSDINGHVKLVSETCCIFFALITDGEPKKLCQVHIFDSEWNVLPESEIAKIVRKKIREEPLNETATQPPFSCCNPACPT